MMDDNRRSSTGRRAEDRWAKWDKRVRDVVLFTLGTAGIINEFFIARPPDIQILVASFALVGLPFALLADSMRRHSSRDD